MESRQWVCSCGWGEERTRWQGTGVSSPREETRPPCWTSWASVAEQEEATIGPVESDSIDGVGSTTADHSQNGLLQLCPGIAGFGEDLSPWPYWFSSFLPVHFS